MGGWKAPGPDCLQVAFYQRSWNVVGELVSLTVSRVLDRGQLDQGMADVLLVLIPKVESPESIRQFCHIILCNVTFKLVTKAIVNRLKLVMEELVSPNQRSVVSRC